MLWHHSGLNDDSSADEEHVDQAQDSEDDTWNWRQLGPTVTKPLQGQHVGQDDRNELCELQTERRAARGRDLVCVGMCVFAVVAVLVCLGLVLSGSSTPRAQALSVLKTIENSTMVQLTISPKPQIVHGTYGRVWEETRDFYGLRSVHGQLFPHTGYTNQALRFDGWIAVETNTSADYEILLSDHRGFRISRTPVANQSRSRCLTFDDIPPLHSLRWVAKRAFKAQDYRSFRVNCTERPRSPVEFVFARIPFIFCPGDAVTKPFLPISNRRERKSPLPASQTLTFHGELMKVELVLVHDKNEALQARAERARTESLELWGNGSSSAIASCPYLEAPLVTFKPRSPGMLHDVIGVRNPRRTRVAPGD